MNFLHHFRVKIPPREYRLVPVFKKNPRGRRPTRQQKGAYEPGVLSGGGGDLLPLASTGSHGASVGRRQPEISFGVARQ